MSRHLFRRLAGLAAWVCLAAILLGSLWPIHETLPFRNADKLQHMAAYAAFAASWAAAGSLRAQRLLLVVVLATVVGGLVELVQPAFGRDADIFDMLADAIGAAAGIPLALAAVKLLVRQDHASA